MIRELYSMHVGRSKVYEIFKDTGITERGFKKVWNNENWITVHSDVYTPENKNGINKMLNILKIKLDYLH